MIIENLTGSTTWTFEDVEYAAQVSIPYAKVNDDKSIEILLKNDEQKDFYSIIVLV